MNSACFPELVSVAFFQNSTLMLSEEEAAEIGYVPPEYSSPVSVLDNAAYAQDSPSPIKYTGKILKGTSLIDIAYLPLSRQITRTCSIIFNLSLDLIVFYFSGRTHSKREGFECSGT